jgi:hypothetical protein
VDPLDVVIPARSIGQGQRRCLTFL